MIVIKFWMTFLFLLMSIGALAANVSNSGEQTVRLIITKDKGAELQLEARQAPLMKVLNVIANKTGLRINYSVLPDELVTATCVGPTVKELLECLLVRKADLVFRYSQQTSKAYPHGQPLEAWVLGAKFETGQTNPVVCSLPGTQQTANAEPDETDDLVKMASSKVPAERAEAIGRLMAAGREGDAIIRKTLETALTDQDARVRVQAVSTLAHREGFAAVAPALQEALHDSDASVRLTAVDNIGADVALLKQALNDSDATVRQLAEIRLEPLLKTGAVR
ncbi:MAG: HEAT repeat domain-containing protein [Methylococcales bacterium]|nr:HEAT repeat domain-containing protein [Methylococcales bacterium]